MWCFGVKELGILQLRGRHTSLVAISQLMNGGLPLPRKFERNMEKAQLIISRNRIGTDGKRICKIMRALRQSLIEANGGAALLRYCELDTMSMVFSWEYFFITRS